MAARKRQRDYAAERRSRNLHAARMGFSSHDELTRARRRGEWPTPAEIKADPTAEFRAIIARDERESQRFQDRLDRDERSARGMAGRHDRLSQEWSDQHSKQKTTKFRKSWSAAKKERYYQTFVKPWGKRREPGQTRAYHTWMNDYSTGYRYDWTDSPYND